MMTEEENVVMWIGKRLSGLWRAAGAGIDRLIIAWAVRPTNAGTDGADTCPDIQENAMHTMLGVLGITGIPIGFGGAGMSPDEIEQRIIRAYVQLACTPAVDGFCTVAVARFGALEARLTEVAEEQRLPGLPWFWLELYSHAQQTVIDSCGCTELDERELAQAVELVVSAQHKAHGLH